MTGRKLGCFGFSILAIAVLYGAVRFLGWVEHREYEAWLADPEITSHKLTGYVSGFTCSSIAIDSIYVENISSRRGGTIISMNPKCKADLRARLDANEAFRQGNAKYGSDNCYTRQYSDPDIEVICFETDGVYLGEYRSG